MGAGLRAGEGVGQVVAALVERGGVAALAGGHERAVAAAVDSPGPRHAAEHGERSRAEHRGEALGEGVADADGGVGCRAALPPSGSTTTPLRQTPQGADAEAPGALPVGVGGGGKQGGRARAEARARGDAETSSGASEPSSMAVSVAPARKAQSSSRARRAMPAAPSVERAVCGL